VLCSAQQQSPFGDSPRSAGAQRDPLCDLRLITIGVHILK
jgi:hypothetical protein